MGPGGLSVAEISSGPDLRAAFLLELPGEVRHHTLDGPLVQRAGLVLQNEAQSVGFLALGKLVALVDIEQRDAFQQLALGAKAASRSEEKVTDLSTSSARSRRTSGNFDSSPAAIFSFFVDFARASKFISR